MKENLQQLQLLQALYVQTQMQSQTGMSAHSRNDFQPYSQQIYGMNSNSSNDQAKRSSSSSFSMVKLTTCKIAVINRYFQRSEFPPRKSIFQERINKHVGECLIIFNSLKRDLDFNIYKENLTVSNANIFFLDIKFSRPRFTENSWTVFSPIFFPAVINIQFLLIFLAKSLTRCRTAAKPRRRMLSIATVRLFQTTGLNFHHIEDISMKYLCDALDMLSNQLHAVRNQLTFFTKSSF